MQFIIWKLTSLKQSINYKMQNQHVEYTKNYAYEKKQLKTLMFVYSHSRTVHVFFFINAVMQLKDMSAGNVSKFNLL